MNNSRRDWKEQQRLRNKASKQQNKSHLHYCWLRADQAVVQLQQLKRSHEFSPVCLPEDHKDFLNELRIALSVIDRLKFLIKQKEQFLKDKKGKS